MVLSLLFSTYSPDESLSCNTVVVRCLVCSVHFFKKDLGELEIFLYTKRVAFLDGTTEKCSSGGMDI